MKKLLVTILFFTILFFQCAEDSAGPTEYSQYENGFGGQIVHFQDSLVVEQVLVTLYAADTTDIFVQPDKVAENQPVFIDSIRTDLEGRWGFANLDAGRYHVLARYVEGTDTLIMLKLGVDFTGEFMNLGIDTIKNPGKISGQVSIEGNLDIPVTVSLKGTLFSAHTDASGSFTLTQVPEGLYTLTYTESTLIDTIIEDIFVTWDSTTLMDDITLKRDPTIYTGSISGTITTEQGDSLSGVLVTSDSGALSAMSDEKGYYEITEIITGEYSLSFQHPHYIDTSYTTLTVSLDEDLENVDMTMNRDPAYFTGSISGRVLNDTLGYVGNAVVSLDDGQIEAVTDSLGGFILAGIIAGTHTLTISHPHYFDSTITGISTGLLENKVLANTVIHGKPEFFKGSISGYVTNEIGNPVPGVRVHIPLAEDSAVTDANGRYYVGNVAAGLYSVEFSHPTHKDTTVSEVFFDMATNFAVVSVTLSRLPENYLSTIRGTVMASDSSVLSQVQVVVTTSDSLYADTTDSTGVYVLDNVLAGSYNLVFTNDQFYTRTIGNVTVGLDEQLRDIDVVLTRKTETFKGNISGTVFDSDSNALPGATISIIDTEISTLSDEEGHYVLENIPANTYDLLITHPTHLDTTLNEVTLVIDNDIVDLSAWLEKDPQHFRGSLSGIVTDMRGLAIEGARVAIAGTGYVTITASDGSYTLEEVVSGNYTVSYSHLYYFDTASAALSLAIEEHKSGIDISMRQNPVYFIGDIAGTIRDNKGHTIEGITITLEPGNILATSDSLGTFGFDTIATGTYILTYSHRDYYPASDSSVIVSRGVTTTVEQTLEKNPIYFRGSISGKVVTNGNAPVSGVTVSTTVGTHSAVTNDSGEYTIGNLIANTYTLAFSHSYYFDTSRSDIVLTVDDDLTNIDQYIRQNDVFFPGAVSGVVVDSVTGAPLENVVVSTTPRDIIATTNSVGQFTFSSIPQGNYLFSTTGDYRSNIVSNVTVQYDSSITIDTLYAVEADIENVTMRGALTANDSVTYISVSITGDSIPEDSTIQQDFTWFPATSTYTSVVQLPYEGTDFTAQIRVFNSDSLLIGFSQQSIVKAQTIILETFSAMNGKPSVMASDTVVTIYDTIILTAAVLDSFSNSNGINSDPTDPAQLGLIEWDIGNTSTFQEVTQIDTIIFAPDSADTIECVIRIRDTDDNVALDTMVIEVVEDIPTATAGIDVDTVYMTEPMTLSANGSDNLGTIVEYAWNLNDSSETDSEGSDSLVFIPVTTIDTVVFAPTAFGGIDSIPYILRVTDDDNNMTYDTVFVFVKHLRIRDSLVLREFYDSTGGPSWSTPWNLDQPMTYWSGVIIAGSINRVRLLTLDSRNLQNGIPSSFSQLDQLISLKLGDNNFTGSIPSVIFEMTQLQTLFLDRNEFTGGIPTDIGNLVNLEELSLNNTNLGGEIPGSIGNLTNLRVVHLEFSSLTGEIPATIGQLTELTGLYLFSNNLSGSIPDEIGNCVSLQYFDAAGNALSGVIPTSIGNLTSLINIRLPRNQLEGTVPAEFGNLTSLTDINLGSNALTGEIPSSFVNLINLERLLFANCLIEGIAEELADTNNLGEYLFIPSDRVSFRGNAICNPSQTVRDWLTFTDSDWETGGQGQQCP